MMKFFFHVHIQSSFGIREVKIVAWLFLVRDTLFLFEKFSLFWEVQIARWAAFGLKKIKIKLKFMWIMQISRFKVDVRM